MAITAKMTGQAMMKALNKEVSWLADTIKVALLTSAAVPDQDTLVYFNQITTEIAAGNGYTAGGMTLLNKTMNYTAATNVIKMDADDISWLNSTLTCRYAVVYVATGTAATSVVLGIIDLGADQSTANTELKITWDSQGVLISTAA